MESTIVEKQYALIARGQYRRIRAVEIDASVQTFDDFTKKITDVALGYHCNYDSVVLVEGDANVKTEREEYHPASGRRGYHTVEYLERDEDGEYPFTEVTDNLLYTGQNCGEAEASLDDDRWYPYDARLFCRREDGTYREATDDEIGVSSDEIVGWGNSPDDVDDFFDSPDDCLEYMTEQDYAGCIRDAWDIIESDRASVLAAQKKEEENNTSGMELLLRASAGEA